MLVAVFAASIFSAGCANDPRYAQGKAWIASTEAEKKRLDDSGFPQYSGGM